MNLDASILRQLKIRAKDEGKSLGDVMSEALAPALSRGGRAREAETARWNTVPLGLPKVELEDKEAVRQVVDDRWVWPLSRRPEARGDPEARGSVAFRRKERCFSNWYRAGVDRASYGEKVYRLGR